MEPTRLFELTSSFFKERQLPISGGIVPVRLAPDIVRFSRNWKEEMFGGNGRANERELMFI